MASDKKLVERTIPGMNRNARFSEVEHAENVGGIETDHQIESWNVL